MNIYLYIILKLLPAKQTYQFINTSTCIYIFSKEKISGILNVLMYHFYQNFQMYKMKTCSPCHILSEQCRNSRIRGLPCGTISIFKTLNSSIMHIEIKTIIYPDIRLENKIKQNFKAYNEKSKGHYFSLFFLIR